MKKLVSVIIISVILIGTGSAFGGRNFENNLAAALSGDVDAMCDVAIAYYNGQGTLKDPFKAKCWTKKAHDLGSQRAAGIWSDFQLWRFSGSCQGFVDDTPAPRYKKGHIYIETVTGMKFRYVPSGCFIMGCHADAEKCKKDESPAHRVCLTGFWMAQYEVTQSQWEAVMGSNPSRFSGNPNLPVENVTYDQAQEFIAKVNSVIPHKVSLPSEAQWEYACRNAGEKINYPWQEHQEEAAANCGTCRQGEMSGQPMAVGSFFPNDLGLYDMAGNVREWCLDFYDKKAYQTHQKENPIYEDRESSRVVRGGSFADNLRSLRCGARDNMLPGMNSEFIGFRLVLEKTD